MKLAKEIRRVNKLTARNATPGQELTRKELREVYAIAGRLPKSRRTKCRVCRDEKDLAITGIGLCRGHTFYVLATGK